MTRLSDALERAFSTPGTGQATGTNGGTATPDQGSAPAPWRFDDDVQPPADDPRPAVAVEARTSATVTETSRAAVAVAEASRTAVAVAEGPWADVGIEEPLAPAVVAPELQNWADVEPMGYKFNAATADKLVITPGVSNALVEQYRRLAALLHHSQVQNGTKTVMVGSAVASEGKTLTATNLALTFSHSYQRRVLLIDADLRRPSVHKMFQLPNDIGLGNTLMRTVEGAPLPLHRISPTLWILTAGLPNSDPMSGLVSDGMKQLLDEAAQQFDWVIVDTPPVALLSDANLLAKMIDVALLVVSANTTPYPLVRRAIDAIGISRILGVVLNRASGSTMVDGYSGYYSRYYGGYGYGAQPEQSGAAAAKK